MGLFSSIKNKLGIGGVSVDLQVPAQVSKDAGSITGKVVLTSKSEQEVVTIKVKLVEEFSTGRGDDKETKTYTLGEANLPAGFTIQSGETKEIAYSIDFSLLQSSNDELKEKGGAMGALGSLAKFANKETSTYTVEAEVDVKSAVLDPSDKKEIRIV